MRGIKVPTATNRTTTTMEIEAGHLFPDVVSRDLFSYSDRTQGDILTVRSVNIWVTRVIDKPRGRVEEDEVTIDIGQELFLFSRETSNTSFIQKLGGFTPIDHNPALRDIRSSKDAATMDSRMIYNYSLVHLPCPTTQSYF